MLAAADAEKVLDLLTGGVVHLAVAVDTGAGKDALPRVGSCAGHCIVVASHFRPQEPAEWSGLKEWTGDEDRAGAQAHQVQEEVGEIGGRCERSEGARTGGRRYEVEFEVDQGW